MCCNEYMYKDNSIKVVRVICYTYNVQYHHQVN